MSVNTRRKALRIEVVCNMQYTPSGLILAKAELIYEQGQKQAVRSRVNTARFSVRHLGCKEKYWWMFQVREGVEVGMREHPHCQIKRGFDNIQRHLAP